MTDQDRSNDALEIEILRADLESMQFERDESRAASRQSLKQWSEAREENQILRAEKAAVEAEWFKQQREWAEREQEQARRLAATEKRAKVAMKYARHTWDCRSPCSCGFADVLASGARESKEEE